MRQIGKLPTESEATRFDDYLTTLGIGSMVEPDDDQWLVWIYEEDHLDKAKEELAAFRDNPDDPKYQQAASFARELQRHEAQAQKKARKRVVNVRDRWNQPFHLQCPVTAFLIFASVIVALLGTSFEHGIWTLCDKTEPVLTYLFIKGVHTENGRLYTLAGHTLPEVARGQVWRIFTPMLLHFSFFHILFNMMWLKTLGGAIEFRLRPMRFLLLVLLISAASNLAQFYLSHPVKFSLSYLHHLFTGSRVVYETLPFFGGMSGVVFGLFGYVWMQSKYAPQSGYHLSPNMVFLMIGWLLLCAVGAVGRIANTAHAVGLITGMLAGYLHAQFMRR